jgi:hypothetical protein
VKRRYLKKKHAEFVLPISQGMKLGELGEYVGELAYEGKDTSQSSHLFPDTYSSHDVNVACSGRRGIKYWAI